MFHMEPSRTETLLAETLALLGGQAVLGARPRSSLQLDSLCRRGLPFAAYERVLGRMQAPAKDRSGADRQRGLAKTTRHRRQTQGRLTPQESETLVRLARVLATASYVLGSEEEARRFLYTPHPKLRNSPPADLIDTELGAATVENILWRAFYGIPA